MTTQAVRRIPIRLTPLAGETLDSWLVAYAARLQVTMGELTGALGIGAGFLRQRGSAVARGSGLSDGSAVAFASGITIETVTSLWHPLARYEAAVRARFGRSPLLRLALPMPWSRYCGDCLRLNGGRWQAAWRLWWFTTCPEHWNLLASDCASCHGRQRERRLRADSLPVGGATCTLPAPGATGRRPEVCGHNLEVAMQEGALEEAPLHFQQILSRAYDGRGDGDQVALAVDRLADLLVIATSTGLGADDIRSALQLPASIVANRLGYAWLALTGRIRIPDVGAKDRPRALPRGWALAGPRLVGRVVGERDARLSPIERLRWRSVAGGGRPAGTDPGERLASCIPEILWSDWAVRLTPTGGWGVDHDAFRMVAAAALRIPGSTLPVRDLLAEREDARSLVQKMSHVLGRISTRGQGPALLRALVQLSDRLQEEGGPIDYARRRRIATQVSLLDRTEWDRICAAGGAPTGGAVRLRCARSWIQETLTGVAPAASTSEVMARHRFALTIPPVVIELLERRARRILDDHGCAGEPLTWSPPTCWVDAEALPGRDPNDLDPSEVGRLLREGQPVGRVADRLGVNIEHVRLVIRQHPPHVRASLGGAGKLARRPFPMDLTPERLRRLVTEERMSVRCIAADYGLDRKTVVAALRREGIRIPDPGRAPKVVVSSDWLRTQYVVRRRTLGDVATELSVAEMTVSNLMRKHGIPLRGRGGASHRASIAAPDGMPEPLASAVLGQAGIDRVRRFQVVSRARSIGEAARTLGVAQPAVTAQLVKLEQACGGPLLIRSTRDHRPQELTPLGRLLQKQADEHLGPHPLAAPDLPYPLSRVIASSGGQRRLHWFQAVARDGSIQAAADSLGIKAGSLTRSVRGLGDACGGPLLRFRTPGRQCRVTVLGQRLLAQAGRMQAHD